MKAYILKEEDFEDLLKNIDRDPRWGYNGGSSEVPTKEEQELHEKVHRFFNYQIRCWVDKVKK